MSDIEVKYKDVAGRVHTGDLAAVTVRELAGARPWREFRGYRGQRHYSGFYWSATTGSHVIYESRLELARLLLADFDRDVVGIVAQPFLVKGADGARVRRHIPDFLLLRRSGRAQVVNVKPAARLVRAKVADALGWAGRVFAGHGLAHEVWTGADPVRLANIRFLAGYRVADRVDAEAVAGVEAAVAGPVPLCEVATDPVVKAAVLHLLWRGVLSTDLDVVLSRSSVLERAS